MLEDGFEPPPRRASICRYYLTELL